MRVGDGSPSVGDDDTDRARAGNGGTDHVEEIVVDGKQIGVEAVVAAGPWNPEVAGMAGIDLPAHHPTDLHGDLSISRFDGHGEARFSL